MVRELLLKEIEELGKAGQVSAASGITSLLETCTDTDADFIAGLAPSELQPLIDALLEVNASFFSQAQAVGVTEAAAGLEKLIKLIFIVAFSPSSEQGTE